MSAFGVITAMISLGVCIVEFCFAPNNKPMAAIQGGMDMSSQEEHFM